MSGYSITKSGGVTPCVRCNVTALRPRIRIRLVLTWECLLPNNPLGVGRTVDCDSSMFGRTAKSTANCHWIGVRSCFELEMGWALMSFAFISYITSYFGDNSMERGRTPPPIRIHVFPCSWLVILILSQAKVITLRFNSLSIDAP